MDFLKAWFILVQLSELRGECWRFTQLTPFQRPRWFDKCSDKYWYVLRRWYGDSGHTNNFTNVCWRKCFCCWSLPWLQDHNVTPCAPHSRFCFNTADQIVDIFQVFYAQHVHIVRRIIDMKKLYWFEQARAQITIKSNAPSGRTRTLLSAILLFLLSDLRYANATHQVVRDSLFQLER